MKINRRTGGVLLAAIAVLAAFTPAAVSASANSPAGGAQADQGRVIAAPGEAAPYVCNHIRQLNADEQKYRTVSNIPFTYTSGVFGTNWFDVACGDLSFTVPPGQQALVDLLAVAELDCQAPPGVDGWCGGRFLINGLPVPLPDNTGLADSYAWDSAHGGAIDWQANTLAQEYIARCTSTSAPCTFRVQLQSALIAGSTSVWIDDLTTRVDVSVGPVSIV
jgi:hypothetical protein